MSGDPLMSGGTLPSAWWVVGRSIRGAAHIRNHQPNQDRVQSWQAPSLPGLPLILAVSDGHGSARSFRSHIGAEFACQAAVTELIEQIAASDTGDNLSVVKSICEDRVPRAIVRRWRSAVEAHLQEHPLQADANYAVKAPPGRGSDWQELERNPLLAYGATLIAVAITRSFICYFQIGDGNVLVVTDEEIVVPVKGDDRLIANETTSLCAKDAWRDFRVGLQPFSGSSPDLIVLSSDGYANSFLDQASFLQVGTDLLATIRNDGLDATANQLRTWLMEASQLGSGDDISVGLIFRQTISSPDGEFPQPNVLQDLDGPESHINPAPTHEDSSGSRPDIVAGSATEALGISSSIPAMPSETAPEDSIEPVDPSSGPEDQT